MSSENVNEEMVKEKGYADEATECDVRVNSTRACLHSTRPSYQHEKGNIFLTPTFQNPISNKWNRSSKVLVDDALNRTNGRMFVRPLCWVDAMFEVIESILHLAQGRWHSRSSTETFPKPARLDPP